MKPSRTLLTASFAVALSAALSAQFEARQVDDGRVVMSFYESQIEDAGLQLEVMNTAEYGDQFAELIENPNAAFAIDQASDLRFLQDRDDGSFVPYGILGGAVRVQGGFVLSSPSTGKSVAFLDFDLRAKDVYNDGPGGLEDPDYFFLTRPGDATGDDFRLCYVKIVHAPGAGYQEPESFNHEPPHELLIKAWDLIINEKLARDLGRPDLADLVVGTGKIQATSFTYEGDWNYPRGQNPMTPYQNGATGASPSDGGGKDVSLGILGTITQLGHTGTFPNGTAGLSTSTTSCNVGSENVPWFAPMNEDHPGIAQALYREMDGRFEQIGTAWMKHGFFALSNSQCIPCQNPSNGTFLGVGCSDTYGTGNNGDRFYLGPRSEWNAYKNTWQCFGSYFDGNPMDCDRDQSTAGLGPVAHRIEVSDADMDFEDATYYYEGLYLVRGDLDIFNNITSRRCNPNWNGFSWQFQIPSPGQGNPQVDGPAILRWTDADMSTTKGQDPVDGNFILSVNTTDLGGGQWRYEYALFNWNSEARATGISFPICDNATDLYFHDGDEYANNEWAPTISNGNIAFRWNGVVNGGDQKEAGPLELQYLFNFGFTSTSAPATRNAVVELEPGSGGDLLAIETLAPGCLNLATDDVSPTPGQNITVTARDVTDHAWFAIVDVDGIPVSPALIFPASPVPNAGGQVDVPLFIPAAAAGINAGLIAGDVSTGPISLIEISNLLRIDVQ